MGSVSVYERCTRDHESSRAFTSVVRVAMGVDGFGRVMSANVALCMQMSRLFGDFRGCCRYFLALVGLRWESVFGCGRVSGNFLGEV